MAQDTFDRREVVKLMAAAGAAIPVVGGLRSAAAHTGGHGYDPAAHFEIEVEEVELRRNAAGRMLKARLYRPKGPGPFPGMIDLHGGAWTRKDRTAEEPMDRALAASGLLVVAVDMTVAPEAPYPAAVQDANWAVRWLKANAVRWNGDADQLGIYGSSSGGHVAELLAMRPRDARYNALPLAGATNVDARIAWAAMRSPISDPFARYENAERRKAEGLITASKTFFTPWDTIHEANPREMLEREEKVALAPLLILQGALDDNVLPATQEKFVAAYKAAGGDCEYHLFENSPHEWVAEPGPQTDKARSVVKAFIARQLNG
jgi:acetyl esterase/lipase